MVKLKIISVGKIKEKFLKDAIDEYKKRLSKYVSLEIIESKEQSLSTKDNIEEIIKEKEGKDLLLRVKEDEFIILLDQRGEMLSSEKFANKIDNLINSGKGKITFLIGGSIGVSDEVYKRSDYVLSFSKMTFLHQMIRVFLLEQIYRSFKIINNETYNK